MPGEREGDDKHSATELQGIMLMLTTVQADTKNHAIKLAEIQAVLNERARETGHFNHELEALIRILRGSNGTDGVQVRMALLEKALASTATGFQEMKELLKAVTSENIKGRWAVVIAIITGLIGVMGMIVSAVLKH